MLLRYLEIIVGLYTEDLRTLIHDVPTNFKLLLSFESAFVISLTVISVIFLAFSTKMKKLCVGIIIFAISFLNILQIILADDESEKIYLQIRSKIPNSVIDLLLDEKDGYKYILLFSLVTSLIAIYFYKWVKFIFLVYAVYVFYQVYKTNLLNGEDPSSMVVLSLLLLGIVIVVYYIIRLLEGIVSGFIIGYIGSTIALGFFDGAFNYPKDYYKLYDMSEDENYKKLFVHPYFGFTILLCIVSMILQKIAFEKK